VAKTCHLKIKNTQFAQTAPALFKIFVTEAQPQTWYVAARIGCDCEDEDLMPSERRFRDDGTKATWFYKPDDGDDRMNENDQDVVHAGIVSKSKKSRNSGRFCNSPPTR
jgi:hypothetical protein